MDKDIYQRTKDKIITEYLDITLRIAELESLESGFIEYTKFGLNLLSNINY